MLTDAFMKTAEMRPRERSDLLVMRVIRYVEEHYQEPITLKSVAAALGYHYQYVSRVFRTTMHIPFRDLVNRYRLEEVKRQLRRGDKNMTHAALDAGFQSVRTFNRARHRME